MKVLYYDCFAGISGDMNLGLMVDLGVSFDYLKSELAKLGLEHEYDLSYKQAVKMGITGSKVDVLDLNNSSHDHDHSEAHHHHHDHTHHDDHQHAHDHDHTHAHDHAHDHSHDHEHKHDHDHSHAHHHSHDHLRDYQAIKSIIMGSPLDEKVKTDALGIFEYVAKAEAKVHGKPIDEVHFHEVGAIDSIVDIVGAAIAMNALEVDAVWSSPVETGSGFVKCAHGLMPVPAPATAEILSGVPMCSKIEGYEQTTPTGAAIIAYYAEKVTTNRAFNIVRTGYGLGTRDIYVPNVLRGFIAEVNDKQTEQWIIETNIDDMSSEQLVYAERKCLEAGALDVYKTAIMMKKGRPAIKLSLLVRPEKIEAIESVIFHHTTAIGLRKYPVEKNKLDRKYEKVMTPYGEITLKMAYYKGECVNVKAEYEDCYKAAEAHGVSIDTVKKAAEKHAEQ